MNYYLIFGASLVLPIISLLVFIYKNYKVVKPDKIGIVSGAFQKVYDEATESYTNFKIYPPGSGVIVFPTINKYDELNTSPKELELIIEEAFTKELFPIRVVAVLSFNFNITNNFETMKAIQKFASKTDEEILDIMKPIFIAEFRDAIATMKAYDVHSSREVLGQTVKKHIQTRSDEFGLHISSMAIKDLKALNIEQSSDDKNNPFSITQWAYFAESLKEQEIKKRTADAENEIKQRKIECETNIILAEEALKEDKAKKRRERERQEVVTAENEKIKTLEADMHANILINAKENKRKTTNAEEATQRAIKMEQEKTRQSITVAEKIADKAIGIADAQTKEAVEAENYRVDRELETTKAKTDEAIELAKQEASKNITINRHKTHLESGLEAQNTRATLAKNNQAVIKEEQNAEKEELILNEIKEQKGVLPKAKAEAETIMINAEMTKNIAALKKEETLIKTEADNAVRVMFSKAQAEVAKYKLTENQQQAEGRRILEQAKADGIKANSMADITAKEELLAIFEKQKDVDKFLIFFNELMTNMPELMNAILGEKGLTGVLGKEGIASIFGEMTKHLEGTNVTILDRGGNASSDSNPLLELSSIAPKILFQFAEEMKGAGFGNLLKKIGLSNHFLDKIKLDQDDH